jgi:circadian clock protein KaiC
MNPKRPIEPLERASTGDSAFDAILGGGIPLKSLTMVAGEPGSGKTVLALQMLFHAARRGKKCLYFSTLAEPTLKLLRYMQLFGFFDPELIDKHIFFTDIAEALRSGAEATLEAISTRLEAQEPDLVVIDSFRAVGDLLREEGVARAFTYDVAVQSASWGATTLLIGEYTLDDIRTLPAFGIADGILWLGSQREGLTSVRELEVLKLRGADYVTGRHFFEIREAGLACYPRVRGPDASAQVEVATHERAPFGVDGLDALLGGGVPRTSATMFQGGTGTGKTLLSLHFLLEGTRRGERGIMFTLEETPDQLRASAEAFGWDLIALENQGLLELHYTSPVELSTDRFLEQARRHILARSARRVVFDSLTSMALGVPSPRRFRELVYAITKHVRAADAALVMTVESAQLLGAATLTNTGYSFAADNIIQLRYVEVDGRLDRAISVLKARGLRHDTSLRALTITDTGLEVARERFHDLRGVLTGLPSLPTRGEPA